MKQSIKDKALILRRKPFGEADLLLTLYTQKHGKLRVVAKGARKITSRLTGYTELFTVVSCHITEASIPIISQISHERIFDGIAENRDLYHKLNVLAELVDKGCEEHESHGALFAILTDGIERLVSENKPLALSLLLWQVISLLGFSPQVMHCAVCGEPLQPDQRASWSDVHGGIVTCDPYVSTHTPLTAEEVKLLRNLSRSPEKFRDVVVPQAVAQKIETVLLSHVQAALEKNFSSLTSARMV